MLEKSQIDLAIDIQSKSYNLLKWIQESLHKGFINTHKVHDWISIPDIAGAWLKEHYKNVPENARPPVTDGVIFDRYMNYFGSYLHVSFDVDHQPDPVLRDWDGGLAGRCPCPCCTYLGPGSHLKTKKVSTADKKLASKLCFHFMKQLLIDYKLAISDNRVNELLSADNVLREAAMCAYICDVEKRSQGGKVGTESLALWRKFAWNNAGSPIHDFVLNTDDVLNAQSDLIGILTKESNAGSS